MLAVYAPAPLTREPGAVPSACFAGVHSPWPPPFAPPTPLRPPPQMPPQWASFALFAGASASQPFVDAGLISMPAGGAIDSAVTLGTARLSNSVSLPEHRQRRPVD